jgi:hypothetical protein
MNGFELIAAQGYNANLGAHVEDLNYHDSTLQHKVSGNKRRDI